MIFFLIDLLWYAVLWQYRLWKVPKTLNIQKAPRANADDVNTEKWNWMKIENSQGWHGHTWVRAVIVLLKIQSHAPDNFTFI